MKPQIIAQGAEAILIKNNGFIQKNRVRKGYRNEELDHFLIKSRTKKEAKLLEKASKIINVPKIREVKEDTIIMDFIDNTRLSESLDSFSLEKSSKICLIIGQSIAKLHELNIIHGDLTTSNMILYNNKIFFIDFGLGFISSRIEDRAVDLYLLNQALKSKHFKRASHYFFQVTKGYKQYKNSYLVLKQLGKVELRGRYKNKK